VAELNRQESEGVLDWAQAASPLKMRFPMPTVFEKLNLKSQKSILVLNAPDSFEKELDALGSTVKVHRQMDKVKSFEFALAFATKQTEVSRLSKA
jgi:hypothetical protein